MDWILLPQCSGLDQSNLGEKGPREHDFTEGRICGLVLFKRRVTDHEVGPAGRRQSGAKAGKRFLVLFKIIEQFQELVKKVGKINF